MERQIIQVKIKETYKLDSSKLSKILAKIDKEEEGGIKLKENCLELYSNVRYENQLNTSRGNQLNTSRGITARIINGKNIEKNPFNVYLQIFNTPYECHPIREEEFIKEIKPNYVDLLREFIY
jgi:hypothetical protein